MFIYIYIYNNIYKGVKLYNSMKTILSLYIDGQIKELAKSKGINLSKCFEEFINLELESLENKENKTMEEEIKLLKTNLSKARATLSEKLKEITSLKKKIKPEKERYISTGIKI